MVSQRYLDEPEVEMLNGAPALTLEYEGVIDEGALADAFSILCDRYPVLRARIRADNHGYLLYLSPDYRPELVTREGDHDTLLQEIDLPWDMKRALSRLTWIRGNGQGFVVFRIDHGICDGSGLVAMHRDLWYFYTALVSGTSISRNFTVSLPVSPTEIVKRYWNDTDLGPRRPSQTFLQIQRENMNDFGKGIWRWLHLSKKETNRLIATAQAEGTSVHGLLCGTVLIGLRAQMPSPEPVPMACVSNVDLRKHVSPPVAPTETTMFDCRHRAEVLVPVNGNPITIGRLIKTQLDKEIARRAFRPLDWTISPTQAEPSTDNRFAEMKISNIGIIPPISHPPDLTLKGLYTQFGQNTPIASYPVCLASTFEGRLLVQLCFSDKYFSVEEVDRITEAIASTLYRHGAKETSGPRSG